MDCVLVFFTNLQITTQKQSRCFLSLSPTLNTHTTYSNKTETQRHLTELERALAAAETRAGELAPATTVTVALAVREAGRAALALRYVAHGAGWTPRYDLRLASARGTLDLACTAVLRNATGEDWPASELRLALADPAAADAAAPPALEPLIASFGHAPHSDVPHQDGSTVHCAPIGTRMGTGNGATDGADTGASSDTNTDAVLTVRSHGPIACTGEEHALAAFVLRDVPAATHYRVAPRAAATAFLVVEGTHRGAQPLLPGPVTAFVDGSLVCQSALRDAGTPGAFAVCLGTDPDVRVEYTLPESVTSDSGFFVFKKHTDSFSGRITVTNNKQGADIMLRVQEQIPQADTTKITVALQQPQKKRGNNTTQTVCRHTHSDFRIQDHFMHCCVFPLPNHRHQKSTQRSCSNGI